MSKSIKVFVLIVLLIALPIGIYLVGKETGFFGHATGTPANLIIDASSVSKSNFSWKNLAQGGEEKTNMLANVTGKLQVLKPNYIRIDHVYDFYDVIAKGPTSDITSFNWTKFDDAVKSITTSGAKPFLSLTYEDTPLNYTNWELMVQRTIEHVSGTLGISDVYYEIGNEPDLFGGWKTYGDKNYFDLYAHGIIGANRAQNVRTYKIGGPATTALYQTWATGFAKFTLANNLRLDFYSWHKYSTNLDNYENNVTNARLWLKEGGMPDTTELIISEIGPDSKNNEIYNNNIGAVHAIASIATLEDSVNKVFTFEIKDGPQNKWGVLTNAGQVKPRYNALLFLNNMTGDSLKVTGQGSWVKAFSKIDKTIKTLIVNYDPEGNHTEAVPLLFTNLPTKNFQYKRINFNDNLQKDIKVATTESSWSTLELMNPNTASIFEITPL